MSKLDKALKLEFKNRHSFREWLVHNAATHEGIFIIGHKNAKIESISYSEALEEALCFGWIDGMVKSIDDDIYIRYFSKRNATSSFSLKNRKTIDQLIKDGRMDAMGYEAIRVAKEAGRYDVDDRDVMTDEMLNNFIDAISVEPIAKEHFLKLPKFSIRAYVLFVSSAKGQDTRARRLARSIARLKDNLPLP